MRALSTEKASGIIEKVKTKKPNKLKRLVLCCLCKNNKINIQTKLSFV
jgi:hypothetical protein